MNLKSLVLVLFGVAAVVALLFVSGVFSPGHAPAPAPGSADGVSRTGADGASGVPLRPTGVDRGVGEAAARRVDADREVDALAGEQEVSIAVRGRLVDADGAPVVGESVTLRQWRTSERLRVDDFDAGDTVTTGGAGATRAETGSDGRFSLRGISHRAGRIALGEQSPWILERGAGDVVASAADVDLGDVRVERAAMLSGVVRVRGGRPAEGVIVRTTTGGLAMFDEGSTRVVTDGEGRFEIGRLRSGAITLRSESPRYLPGKLEVTLQPGERRVDLELVVDEGRSIAGQVLDDLGRPIAGARVGAQRSQHAPGMQVTSFRAGETATTDENGFFVLGGLEGETAFLRASSEGHGSASRGDVAVGAQNVRFELARRSAIAGVLRDEAGEPIAGSTVSVVAASRRRAAGGSALPGWELDGPRPEAKTGADGSFRIEGVVPGLVSLVARGEHREARIDDLDLRPGEERLGQDMVARAGVALAVTVVDHAGAPVQGAEVAVTKPRERAQDGMVFHSVTVGEGGQVFGSDVETLGKATTDAQGRARIAGLAAAAVEVVATHETLAASLPERVALPAVGEVQVQLALREAGTAVVRCQDTAGEPLAGGRFEIVGPAGKDSHVADGAGRKVIAGLVPGAYTAVVTLPPRPMRMGGASIVIGGGESAIEQTRVPFDVVAGQEVEVLLTKPVLTRVTGRVHGPSGGIAGVVVQLEPLGEGEDVMAFAGLTSGPSDTTGADGRFAIDDVNPGRYAVEWGRQDQIVRDRREIEILPGQAALELDLPLRGGDLRVTVLDDGGQPLAGARVRVLRGGAGSRRRSSMVMFSTVSTGDGAGPGSMTSMTLGDDSVSTDADGVAMLEGVPPGEFTVSVEHAGFTDGRSEPVTVTDGGLADAGIVRLEPAATVGGRVKGLRPGPGGMVMARVEYRREDASEWQRMVSSADRFHLDSLTPGAWVFRASEITPGSEPGPEVRAELERGENPDLELTLR